MSYKIKTSTKVSTSQIFKDLKSSIESLVALLAEKWNSSPRVIVNLNQENSGVYLLSYSINVNGNNFYLKTEGGDLNLLTEKLKNNIFNI